MVSALLTTGAAYAVRSMVLRSAGLDAAGHYHAAWMLGGLYVGFILQALAVDYFPRLVGVVADDAACNRLVNEQTQMCLLLAAPGVLATLTLAPLAVEWFYSDRFRPATEVLRWICLGTALRIVIWPISFIIVARNRQRLFVAIELAWTLLYLALTWLCLQRYGIEGAGMACLGAYLFHAALVYPAVWRLSRFGWTGVNLRTAAWFILAAAAVFCSPHLLAPWWAGAFGAAMTLLATVVCARRIVRLTDPLRCPRALAWLLAGGRP
jgi:PST family polysaccharide transporter